DAAESLAATVDQNDGGVDAVLIAAGVVMGAGAALWRHTTRWPRAAGVALPAGALLRDPAAGEASFAGVPQVLLALFLVHRLTPPASRLAALAGAALVTAVLVVLPEYGLLHPEVQIIK
ncbi:MAG: hypothetical protein AVDCRST_MAG30-726, partial [uncultured Solirubrobacteraceae bacterium]